MKFVTCSFFLLIFITSNFAQQNSSNIQNRPDFSGTWILDLSESDFGVSKGELIYDALTLLISQETVELKVVRTWTKEKKERTQHLLYFADGRGEKNYNFDESEVVKSKTKWKGNTIEIKGTSSVRFLNNEMTFNTTEKWQLSADGQELRITNSSIPLNGLPGIGHSRNRKVFKKKT